MASTKERFPLKWMASKKTYMATTEKNSFHYGNGSIKRIEFS